MQGTFETPLLKYPGKPIDDSRTEDETSSDAIPFDESSETIPSPRHRLPAPAYRKNVAPHGNVPQQRPDQQGRRRPCDCDYDDKCNMVEGPPGPRGPQGPPGPQGSCGVQGIEGPPGPRGPMGPCGPKGDCGECGTCGPKGDCGECGPQGPRGEQGEPGHQGPPGPPGPQGSKGDQGDQGVVGPRGEQGVQGPPGPMGPAGPEGKMGPVGPRGYKGEQGPVGPQGPCGKCDCSCHKAKFNSYQNGLAFIDVLSGAPTGDGTHINPFDCIKSAGDYPLYALSEDSRYALKAEDRRNKQVFNQVFEKKVVLKDLNIDFIGCVLNAGLEVRGNATIYLRGTLINDTINLHDQAVCNATGSTFTLKREAVVAKDKSRFTAAGCDFNYQDVKRAIVAEGPDAYAGCNNCTIIFEKAMTVAALLMEPVKVSDGQGSVNYTLCSIYHTGISLSHNARIGKVTIISDNNSGVGAGIKTL